MTPFLRAIGLLLISLVLPWAAWAEDNFLAAEQAFPTSAQLADAHTVVLRFDVAPGYHLYRERLLIETRPAGVPIGPPELPEGHWIHDAGLDKDMAVFTGSVQVRLPVPHTPAQDFELVVHHQGCADAGLCYPPQQQVWQVRSTAAGLQQIGLDLSATAAPTTATTTAPTSASTATPTAPAAPSDNLLATTLQAGRLWRIAGLFLLAGVLLSFTPCVLPMVPILSSIIVGQQQPVSRARGLSLSVAYALGMAMVYTAFGVAAGLAGEGLAARLQQPAVLGAFALLLVGLSLSMFGVYNLQLPNAWQSKLNEASGRLRGGQHAGVFVMGGVSALIVGPCVAAPLAGALVFISQTKDVLIGGLALFSLACGMSVPLLLVGLSAGSLLPRAGAWMEHVKRFFGLMLLGVAWWMVSPVLPATANLALAGAALLTAGVWLWSSGARLRMAASLLLGLVGVAELVGALAGSTQTLSPLAVLAQRSGASVAVAAAEPAFRRIRSVAELDAALREAPGPTLLDVYADWCVACKEMEHLTFADPAVQAEMRKFQRLQVDVTANNDNDRALLKRFGLFGPPGIVFFDPKGQELAQARVVGFQPAEAFSQHLRSMAM